MDAVTLMRQVAREMSEPTSPSRSRACMNQILIIEPDFQIRRLLEHWVEEAGYAVMGDQTEAGAGGPDLVIAGLGSSSTTVAERIDALRRVHSAPLLLVSSRFRRGLAESHTAARHLGVQAVLPTPFNQAELLSAIASAQGA